MADMPRAAYEVHEVDPPERWCLGDDPCVCHQVALAREEAISAAVQRVEALVFERAGGVWDEWTVSLGSVRRAIRGES